MPPSNFITVFVFSFEYNANFDISLLLESLLGFFDFGCLFGRYIELFLIYIFIFSFLNLNVLVPDPSFPRLVSICSASFRIS